MSRACGSPASGRRGGTRCVAGAARQRGRPGLICPESGQQARKAGIMSSNAIGHAAPTRASPRPQAPARGAAGEPGLSIVVPVYNEAAGLAALHGRIAEVARRLRAARGLMVEIVYVDDGSRDATLAVARALTATSVDLHVVSLSRNFGKEAALAAGLAHAPFGARLVLAGDAQHPPTSVETLVNYWLDQ